MDVAVVDSVVTEGMVDTNNSSNTPLVAAEVFTGTVVDTLDYALVFVTVYSDVASATDGLRFQMSSDGTTWRASTGDMFTIDAGVEKTFSFQPHSRYYRIAYTNGGTNQTTFDLHTVMKKTNSKHSTHRIADSISPQDDASLHKSVLTALNDLGIFINIGATKSNNLRVANAEDGLAISKGDVTGLSFTHKFGNAPDFDTGDNEITIWDGANDAGLAAMAYTYSSTADIDRLSSSDNGDTQDIEVQGLDTNYDLVNQTITLTGQTPVALTTSLIRVFRLKNVGSTDLAGDCYCFVNGATTGGVPDTATDVRAVILIGNNQTEMAVYTVPNGKTGYLRSWFAASAGAKKATNYVMKLQARPDGQVFQLKHRTSVSDGFPYQHEYVEPEVFAAKTDIAMTAQVTAAGITDASVSAGFDIVLVDD